MKSRIKSESKQNLEVLLRQLQEITTVSEEKVRHDVGPILELEWVFISIIDFGNILSTDTKTIILRRAFNHLARSQDYSKTSFLEQINKEIVNHHKSREGDFHLLTTLSIKGVPFRKLRIGDCIIQIHGRSFPNQFKKIRTDLIRNHSLSKEKKDYCRVSIIVKSKDFKDAYEKAFYSLELFRSFFCLVLNSSLELRFDDRNLRPINRIRQGEISTLHKTEGHLAHEKLYWYVPDYQEAEVLLLSGDKRARIQKTVRQLIRKYNNCSPKHKATVGKALFNYVGAFDEKNKYVCFLKAWMVLETLTDTDDNDKLIRRCTALFGKEVKPYHKQVMEALRLFRNEYVHEGDSGQDPLFACYKLQQFIFLLTVRFNLQYSGFFNNIDEAVAFLDNYNPEIQVLKSRKRILNKVIQIRENNTKS